MSAALNAHTTTETFGHCVRSRAEKRRLGEGLPHGRQRRLRLSRLIDEAEGPVVDGAAAAPPLVGPGIDDRSAGALHERRSQRASW